MIRIIDRRGREYWLVRGIICWSREVAIALRDEK